MPTIPEMMACAEMMGPVVECPRPPPPSVCKMANGAIIRVMQSAPGGDAAGSVMNLHIECGERLADEVITPCAMVTAYNTRDGLVSEIVSRSYPIDGCVPVPEPPLVQSMTVALIAAVAITRWRHGSVGRRRSPSR